MSLVGPRPCVPYEFDQYLPSQKRRFETLPGLTGLWQVSGKNNTTFFEMIALDIHYAENKSLWLDLKIMFETLPTLVSQVREVWGRSGRRLESCYETGQPRTGQILDSANVMQKLMYCNRQPNDVGGIDGKNRLG